MSTNRDLLKEAIADAKTIKEAALVNAKKTLEESFAPYLKEKLSAKLLEMDNEGIEEEVVAEVEENVEEVTLEELMAELGEDTIDEAKKDDSKKDEKKDEKKDVKKDEKKPAKKAEKKSEDEDLKIEDMSDDDLTKYIEDVIKGMVKSGELEGGEDKAEDVKIDDKDINTAADDGEDIDISGLVNEEESFDEYCASMEESDGYTEKVTDPSPKSPNAVFQKGKDEYVTDTTEEDDAPYTKDAAEKIAFYETEVKESKTEILALKEELENINLLNAKLLYTNKIFRNKSLSESQKVKVLSAFDKAKTVKETKLVYETLQESLKISTKTPIKESLGSASKALGINQNKPIIEDASFARMRELAFGKK